MYVAEDAGIYIVKLLKLINKECEFLSLSNLQYHLEEFTERIHSIRNELPELFPNLLCKSSDENGFRLSSSKEIKAWSIFLRFTYKSINKACLTHTSSACEYNKS